MMKKLLVISLIILFRLNTYGQIFIPIFLSSPDIYYCKPQNEKAITYFNRANDFYDKNINTSIDYLEGAIKLDSLFCDAYYSLIVAYSRINDFDNSLKYVDLALKNNSLNPWLIKTKGILLYKSMNYQKASDYYDKLIDLQPRNPIWYYYSAKSLIKLNLLDSAKVNAVKMETIINQNYNTDLKVLSYYLQGKIAYQKDDFDRAKRVFNIIKKDFRRDPEFCYYYGMTCLKLNDNKNARKYIKKSIKFGYNEVQPDIKEILGL